jgi:hypothetical protein
MFGKIKFAKGLREMTDKNIIKICDAIDCKNRPTWKQAFFTEKGVAIVDLCEEHHFILRTKVNQNVKIDENVLKWLLLQDANHHKVTKYGLIKGRSDIEFLKELDKIELVLE